MKFPWQHRADVDSKHREREEKRLTEVGKGLHRARRVAAVVEQEGDLNGFTRLVVVAFGIDNRE